MWCKGDVSTVIEGSSAVKIPRRLSSLMGKSLSSLSSAVGSSDHPITRSPDHPIQSRAPDRPHSIRIKHIAQRDDAFKFVNVGATDHWQDIHVRLAHSFQREVQRVVGVDV